MSDPNTPKKTFSAGAGRGRLQRDIDDEMRFHLDARTDALIRDGHAPDDARRIALEEYGDVSAARSELATIDRKRHSRVALREWLASWRQDIRFALRGLRARPGFSLTILITIALGVGANAAIFSVVDRVLLRPLPYAQPDRLVHLWEAFKSNVDSRSEASYPDYLDWRTRTKTFADLAGYTGGGFLLGGAQPMTIAGPMVTANFFDVLGVKPLIGRTFKPGEDAVGAPRIAMLTYGFWQRMYGGDAGAVGKTLILDGNPTTIVGVLPRDFQFSRQPNAEIWVALARPQAQLERRGNHWLKVVARLKPGVTVELATRDFSAIMHDLAREYPPTNAGRDGVVVPLRDELVGPVRPILLVLYGAVGVVLLIACVNVANLLLIRGAEREREIAVRVALGAGRARLVRQLLTESVLLGACGGVLGIGVAIGAERGLIGLLPPQGLRNLPKLTPDGLDSRILGYAIAISIIAGIGFGLLPALRLVRPNLNGTLRSGGRGATGGGRRLRDGLVVGEVALTVMLLSGALLFGRSVMRLLAIDPGFRAEHLMTTFVLFPATDLPDQQARASATQRTADALRAIPGVQSVGYVSRLPLDFGNSTGFAIIGQPAAEPGHDPTASYRTTSTDYFNTLGIPIVSGRVFGMQDDGHAPLVAVVNRAFAKAYLGESPAVGQRLAMGRDTVSIVGVVGDVPIGGIDEKIPPTLYIPFAQDADPGAYMAIRTQSSTVQMAPAIRAAIASVSPSAAITAPTTMDELLIDSPSVFSRRFPLFLVGAFAATALLLAVVGIYAVVSYSVAQRTREMGIRMALGAHPSSLVGLVVRHGGWMAAAGIVIGVAASILGGRFAEKLLYGVSASDPTTYIGVALLLSVVAVTATLLPARRATHVDPSVALRAEQ